MAYTVLARKYRSQTFDDVIGQDAISQTLKNAIRTKRVAHAYLFTGTRGVGKTTMARILAKSLNCLESDEPTEKPCCKCESCVAVNLGEDIDVIEIDGASNNSVDEVRRLRENAIYRPARARFKIYVIDEVHMLSTSAFNALLKILEEPPEHVKFIFATTEPNKVIPTIQSRCQRFDFNNIGVSLIAEQLRKILKAEKIKYDDDLVVPLARMANGSMRDGLSLLDRLISTGIEPLNLELIEQFLGCPNSESIVRLVGKIADSDAAGTLEIANELFNSGLSEVQIADALVDFMRDIMVAKSAGADSEMLILTAGQKEAVTELAEKYDVPALIYNITALEKTRWGLKNSETARALLEALLLRLAMSEHFLNVEQLLGGVGKSGSQPVKKNAKVSNAPTKISKPVKISPAETANLSSITDISSIKANWSKVVGVIAAEMGGATAGLLSKASPVKFDGSNLTILVDAASKNICQSNGRVEQIQSVLGEHLAKPVTLKLEVAERGKDASGDEPKRSGSAKRRNELMSDPAVRKVLGGLGGRIVRIED
jgi:DNA polymerase-3 subunit gamma/tau